MGDFEVSLSGEMESSVKYHSSSLYFLTSVDKTAERQYLMDSFGGALSS